MIWNPFDWWWQLFKVGKLVPHPDEDSPEDRDFTPVEDNDSGPMVDEGEVDEHEPTVPIVISPPLPATLRGVGAWTGYGSFGDTADMARDVAFAKWLGLSRLDVMVNDHSAKRQPRDFDTYNKGRIAAFCKRAVGEGIAVHLTTWIMPHEKYLRQMGTQMTDLLGQSGAQSVMFDAEEPWTLAAKAMKYEEAGALVGEVMGPVPFGVTGIGYASGPKLGPLVRRAKYMAPQCYSTKGNTLDPKKAAVQLSNLWRNRFGDRELVVGLAGYNQDGRPGYTKQSFMTAAFETAKRAQPTSIVYWSLRNIRASRSTANIIRDLARTVQANVA
jgi:hypothetical protein